MQHEPDVKGASAARIRRVKVWHPVRSEATVCVARRTPRGFLHARRGWRTGREDGGGDDLLSDASRCVRTACCMDTYKLPFLITLKAK